MTEEEFLEWKSHRLTKEIFAAWRKRQGDLENELVESLLRMDDIRKLTEIAAAIKIYKEILEMEY